MPGTGKKRYYPKKNGDFITSRKAVADEFAVYFGKGVQVKLLDLYGDNRRNSCTTTTSTCATMFFHPVDEFEILRIISCLKNTSPGIDDVPVAVIKHCAPEIAVYLSDLLNQAVLSGQFPTKLKLSLVVPIFKKGDPNLVENYRQVALVSVFSKILERAVYNRIVAYLERYNILTECQHGFRAGYSTETATVGFMQCVWDAVDSKRLAVGIFFDLSQAFDTIDLSYLSKKLDCLGIRGFLNRFLVSFASERRIIVRNAGELSDCCGTNIGTPQGSVLGPLLFLMYVNDLPQYIKGAKVYMYADDTSFLVTADSRAQLDGTVSTVIASFLGWCERNRLIVNYGKTVIVGFCGMYMTPFDDMRFSVGRFNVPVSDSTQFLGITVDSRIDWNEHISTLCTRLGRAYYAILVVKNNFDRSTQIKVYYSLVQSVLAFNIIVWGQAAEFHRVFVLQKKIIRSIFNIAPRDTCKGAFKESGILTFVSLYVLKIVIYIHVNKRRFLVKSKLHDHNTRNDTMIHLSKIQHLNYRKSPHYAGCSIYNRLPSEWRELPLADFKLQVKRVLKDGAFYTLDEFFSHLDAVKTGDRGSILLNKG